MSRIFKCFLCDLKSPVANDIIKHLQKLHGIKENTDRIFCISDYDCEKGFLSYRALRKHISVCKVSHMVFFHASPIRMFVVFVFSLTKKTAHGLENLNLTLTQLNWNMNIYVNWYLVMLLWIFAILLRKQMYVYVSNSTLQANTSLCIYFPPSL